MNGNFEGACEIQWIRLACALLCHREAYRVLPAAPRDQSMI